MYTSVSDAVGHFLWSRKEARLRCHKALLIQNYTELHDTELYEILIIITTIIMMIVFRVVHVKDDDHVCQCVFVCVRWLYIAHKHTSGSELNSDYANMSMRACSNDTMGSEYYYYIVIIYSK